MMMMMAYTFSPSRIAFFTVLAYASTELSAASEGVPSCTTNAAENVDIGRGDVSDEDISFIQRGRAKSADEALKAPASRTELQSGVQILTPPMNVDSKYEEDRREKAEVNVKFDRLNIDFDLIGCYPLAPGDSDADEPVFHDLTCDLKGPKEERNSSCRSGLPFFRLLMPKGQDSSDCPYFCLAKGFDLSGVVRRGDGSKECRCGASISNGAAWHRRMPRKELRFSGGVPLKPGSPDCKILVWKYQGSLESSSVPHEFIHLSQNDLTYIKGVVYGGSAVKNKVYERGQHKQQPNIDLTSQLAPREIEQIKARMDEERNSPSLVQQKSHSSGLCNDRQETGVSLFGFPASCFVIAYLCLVPGETGNAVRSACKYTCGQCDVKGGWLPCYPGNCGAGAGPWKVAQADGLFAINYVFEENVDETRRDAFALAAAQWQRNTCIRFVEGGGRPRLRVGVRDLNSCYSDVGYPGPDGESFMNLGFCRSNMELGSIIHELGHVMGRNHEQTRPDAAGTIHLPDGTDQGPYLKVHWQNIAADWVGQYKGDSSSYVGSADAGYAPYDYGSIMHYPRMEGDGDVPGGTNFDTVDAAYNDVVGQRVAPSHGDLAKMNDMYQCGHVQSKEVLEKQDVKHSWWDPRHYLFESFDRPPTDSWVASAWGECMEVAPESCGHKRHIHCQNTLSGTKANESACTTERPDDEEECACSTGCQDHYPTGINLGEFQLSCAHLKDYCKHPNFTKAVTEACLVTCGACGEGSQAKPSCRDLFPWSGIRINGIPYKCSQLASMSLCVEADNKYNVSKELVMQRCPQSCNVCPGRATSLMDESCQDDDNFTDTDGHSCLTWESYDSSECSLDVKQACPKTCGLC